MPSSVRRWVLTIKEGIPYARAEEQQSNYIERLTMDINAISAIAASGSALFAGVALIAAALQVYYLRKQITADHEWKRREKAFSYSQIHHPEVRAARLRLAADFSNARARIPIAEFKAAEQRNAKIKEDMRTILTYLENMGLAVYHNVADVKVIYDMNGTDIIRFGNIYREYIDDSKGGNERVWQNVDRLIVRLVDEDGTRRGALGPTA
jgi:hypothetical protein